MKDISRAILIDENNILASGPEIDWSLAAPTVQKNRVKDLLGLLPATDRTLLEIGARGGYMTRLLARYFDEVTALDLERPEIVHPKVKTVKGDVTRLDFADNSFDAALCSEVLEHIHPSKLAQACSELKRVAKNHIVIGVPFEEDIRIGRVTCSSCGRVNPPYGHLSSFSEKRLDELFGGAEKASVHFMGKRTGCRTNALSVRLLDMAGNPYGPYVQEENCLFCLEPVGRPGEANMVKRALAKAANTLDSLLFGECAKPRHIHVLFRKGNG